MRREILQPDSQGRVSLAQLGFEGEVVAEEAEPGTWQLRLPRPGETEPADRTGGAEPSSRPPDADDEAPAQAARADTVSFGRSGSRVQRPASMPPPGPRRRSSS